MTEKTSNLALKALTEWWGEMGVEADPAAIKAYLSVASTGSAAPPAPSLPQGEAAAPRPTRAETDWVAEARKAAAACQTLEDLSAAIAAFDGCDLKAGCQNTVVFDGVVGAPIMVIGEGPGADEDRIGKPFVGRAGKLLDRMLGSIGISRQTNALITNVNYWRPPGNRNPEAGELAVCRPFVDRMVELTAPKLVIAAGGVPAKALLETGTGIMRLRGTEKPFTTPDGTSRPLFPVLHPAFLLRRPQEKSRAWRDLQVIEHRMRDLGVSL
ncbi:MAG: uracil-DNA glycosylase [Hyphomonadaceae bacterium]|nr:uracil-DNA glycosylase [Hyphomonadaceae bacterium]